MTNKFSHDLTSEINNHTGDTKKVESQACVNIQNHPNYTEIQTERTKDFSLKITSYDQICKADLQTIQKNTYW